MSKGDNIARLFIQAQQYKERCWKAHIAKRPREALEQATMLQLKTTELMRALAEEENDKPFP